MITPQDKRPTVRREIVLSAALADQINEHAGELHSDADYVIAEILREYFKNNQPSGKPVRRRKGEK